jgi:two-component system, NarL family, nitrate/nitrite response regulator NarL
MAEKPIRVLILDDHGVFRESLALFLSATPGLEVMAHHATVAEAIHTLSQATADVILLDYALQNERPGSLLDWMEQNGCRARILLLTAGLPDHEALWFIRRGVAGIVLKDRSLEDVLHAIRTVAQRGSWLDQRFLRLVISAATGHPEPVPVFTEQERKALKYVCQGLSNKEMSSQMRISETAVKATVQRVFDKTGVRTRGNLIRIVLQKYSSILEG